MEKTKIKTHPDQEIKTEGPLCEKDEEAKSIEHTRALQEEVLKKLEEWRKRVKDEDLLQ
jgi:hypothetical protein